MRKTIAVLAATLALVLAGAASGGGHGFSADVTNPWFPLTPGTTLHLQRGQGRQAVT